MMTQYERLILILGFAVLLMSPTTFVARSTNIAVDTVRIVDTVYLVKKSPKTDRIVYRGDTKDFLHKLFMAEGQGRVNAVNKYGHLGKYQIHPQTLRYIGFEVDRDEFLQNEELQDSAVVALLRKNYQTLRSILKTWDGKVYNGVHITKSGLLAGAHLMGVGGVLAYLHPDKYDYPVVDGNGVHIEQYIRKFGGYRITL